MLETGFSFRSFDETTSVIDSGRMLDNNNAQELVDLIADFQQKGIRFIIVDMSGLEFISSAGVGSILGSVETSREIGGDIILCNPSDTILHVLKVLDLLDYLTTKPTMDAAIEFCKTRA